MVAINCGLQLLIITPKSLKNRPQAKSVSVERKKT